MIRNFRKVVLIIMAIVSSVSFTSCMRDLNLANAKEVADLLQAKYGIEFVVDSIGNRLASDRADTLTAYCHPKENEKVVFEAVMSVSRELISDNYPKRLLEIEAKDRIETEFSRYGINANVSVSLSKLTVQIDPETASLDQIIKDNPALSLTFSTVVCNYYDASKLYDVVVSILEGLYSEDPEMQLGTMVWNLSESAYQNCADEMNKRHSVDKTFFESFDPLGCATLAINNGLINVSKEEFYEAFGR